MTLRILIADDEKLARQRVTELLSRESDIEIVGECANGLEAVQAIEALEPDLVLLDIRMPELDGLGVVEAVGADRMPTVLFITAYDEYACRAFEAQAIDYLLKPFDPDRFTRAIDRARTWVRGRKMGQTSASFDVEALLAQMRPDRSSYLDRMLVRHEGRMLLVRTQAIQWLEAEDNYVRLHIESGSYLVRQTMAGLLKRLDPARFRRIHRSAIVNLDAVKELQPWSGGDYLVLLRDGTKLTLSRTFKDQFAEGW